MSTRSKIGMIPVRLTATEYQFLATIAEQRLEKPHSVLMSALRHTPLPKKYAPSAPYRRSTSQERRIKAFKILVLAQDQQHFDELVKASGGNAGAFVSQFIQEWQTGQRTVNLPNPLQQREADLERIGRLPKSFRAAAMRDAELRFQQRVMRQAQR